MFTIDYNCKITFEKIIHSLNPVRHNKLCSGLQQLGVENIMNNIDLPESAMVDLPHDPGNYQSLAELNNEGKWFMKG